MCLRRGVGSLTRGCAEKLDLVALQWQNSMKSIFNRYCRLSAARDLHSPVWLFFPLRITPPFYTTLDAFEGEATGKMLIKKTSASLTLAVLSVSYWPWSILLRFRRLSGRGSSDGWTSSQWCQAEEAPDFAGLELHRACSIVLKNVKRCVEI